MYFIMHASSQELRTSAYNDNMLIGSVYYFSNSVDLGHVD